MPLIESFIRAGRSGVGARLHTENSNLNALVNGYLLYDTIDYDAGLFAVGSPPYDRLVIPANRAGFYTITAQTDTATSVNQSEQAISIVVNGTVFIAKHTARTQGTNGASLNIAAHWQFDVGDYVQVYYNDTSPNSSGLFNVSPPGSPSLGLSLL